MMFTLSEKVTSLIWMWEIEQGKLRWNQIIKGQGNVLEIKREG